MNVKVGIFSKILSSSDFKKAVLRDHDPIPRFVHVRVFPLATDKARLVLFTLPLAVLPDEEDNSCTELYHPYNADSFYPKRPGRDGSYADICALLNRNEGSFVE